MSPFPRLALAFTLALVSGCAESNTHHDAGRGPDAAIDTDTSVPVEDTGALDASHADVGAVPGGLVVNEIEATGTEFVELLNTGAAPIDLSALRVTDSDAGAPNASHVTALPTGLVLHAGERFVVVTNVSGAAAGLSMGADCMLTGVDRCLQVSFGLSNTNGDGLFVLASDDSVVADAAYPAMAAPDGSSYGRVPDGTGAFTTCTPTPGAPNTP